jgi:hypothetical protein
MKNKSRCHLLSGFRSAVYCSGQLSRDGRHWNDARRVVPLEQHSGFEAAPMQSTAKYFAISDLTWVEKLLARVGRVAG